MIKRLDRIKWNHGDMGIHLVQKGNISLFELCDSVMKELLRINDNELDFFIEHMAEDEAQLITSQTFSFCGLRQVIRIRNKYLTLYNNQESI